MMSPTLFRKTLHTYYSQNKRIFPWRETTDLYHILVSEVMLQQTQVDRVIPKYHEFLKNFPTISSLAKAPFQKVLKAWSGLGYNRRALYLKKTAEEIVTNYNSKIPKTMEELVALPGIGANTAGAILAYAHNKPAVFIETNIRSVFIHHYFNNRCDVRDTEIMKVLTQVLDQKNPRKFFTALMDYGAYLKKKHSNPSRKSKHHTKQSKFEGSNRQLRGQILQLLLKKSPLNRVELLKQIKRKDVNVGQILSKLQKDGLISAQNNVYSIS